MMRFLSLTLLAAAAPLCAQSLVPPRVAPPVVRGQPTATIVAEPIALAIAGFDADQDGLVTRAEVNGGATRAFGTVAQGKPDIGYIGWSDFALRWLGDANALPGPFDVDENHDDRITAAETSRAMLAAFARFDKNKDGTLSRAELVTIRASAIIDGQRPEDRRRGTNERPDARTPR